ncbi:hypothetical protein LZ31DRAFT_448633, partial [Colletotrichum somersetense]
MSDTFRSIVQICTSLNGFIPPHTIDIPTLSNQTKVLGLMRNSIYLSDLVECGSLALSILRQDEIAMARTLQSYQYTLKEVNSLGQTTCHIAVVVGNLRILQLVLLYTNPNFLNKPDNWGYFPVDYALSIRCHQDCQKSQDSSVCNGCKVLEMVLNSDCALYPRSLREAL